MLTLLLKFDGMAFLSFSEDMFVYSPHQWEKASIRIILNASGHTITIMESVRVPARLTALS
jgi:hypothetical protein